MNQMWKRWHVYIYIYILYMMIDSILYQYSHSWRLSFLVSFWILLVSWVWMAAAWTSYQDEDDEEGEFDDEWDEVSKWWAGQWGGLPLEMTNSVGWLVPILSGQTFEQVRARHALAALRVEEVGRGGYATKGSNAFLSGEMMEDDDISFYRSSFMGSPISRDTHAYIYIYII